MILLAINILIIISIIALIAYIPIFLGKFSKRSTEKYITFECGINLDSFTRKPFAVRFFLLIVLFIVFDVEIILIFIVPVIIPRSPLVIIFLSLFIILLLVGIFYEWKEGSLNWKL